MKTIILILIIFSIQSYSQDLYVEMPDCFCKPFPIESKSQLAINEFDSYIDTCEIIEIIGAEEYYNVNRCDYLANKHYRGTNNSESLNKYIKTINIMSKNKLFGDVEDTIFYKQVSEISDEFLEIKNKLIEVQKNIGKFTFLIASNYPVYIKFENHISLEYINETFSEYFEIKFSYLAYLLSDIEESVTNIMSTKGNKINFLNKVENIRIIDFLGSYSEIDYKAELDISDLQRGVYILQFTFDNQIYNYKFIKD